MLDVCWCLPHVPVFVHRVFEITDSLTKDFDWDERLHIIVEEDMVPGTWYTQDWSTPKN